MSFIDNASISITAGKGGNGAVSFRRERFIPRGGPDGGDGGNGGDIIFVGKHDEHTLSAFRAKKRFSAEDGQDGMSQKMHGKNGTDSIITVPLGTTIALSGSTLQEIDIVTDGQQFIAAKGGRGGWGNSHFATSIKQAPEWSKPGLPGETFAVHLELKLIADVGLVGLPNAGKSTLLSVISNAHPKIADYPFTTIEPQLGVARIDHHNLVVADIPGLIAGAAAGRGLGHEFLRHIQRTKLLLFMIEASSEHPLNDLADLEKELTAFDQNLIHKPRLVAISKSDIVTEEQLRHLEKELRPDIIFSAATRSNLDELLRLLVARSGGGY